jgi:hypothetical protein
MFLGEGVCIMKKGVLTKLIVVVIVCAVGITSVVLADILGELKLFVIGCTIIVIDSLLG